MSGIKNRVSRGTSLRAIFSTARFIHAEDFSGKHCHDVPEACMPGDIYVVSPAEDSPDEAAARAIARGAVGIVTERLLPVPSPQCIVRDVGEAYSRLRDALSGSPGKSLLTIGVVGRHGKTSAVTAIAASLREQGLRTAYRCDLGAGDGVTQGLPVSATPDAAEFISWLMEARDATAAVAVAELSSTTLSGSAATPLYPDLLVVTDGLDRAALENAVALLPEDGVIVANSSCPHLSRWLEGCEHPVLRFGIDCDADVSGTIFRRELGEMTLLVTAGNTTATLRTKLTGRLLAQAQLAGITVGLLVGGKLETSVQAFERLTRIPGRMQRIPSLEGAAVFVDSADCAPRLVAALKSLRGEVTGPFTTVLMLPTDCRSEDRAALGRSAEQACGASGHVVITAMPAGRKTFNRDVHDALDGMENPVRHHWITDWKKAVRVALGQTANHGAIVICCPRGCMDGLSHRALHEQIAAHVGEENKEPRIFQHPALLAAS